MFIKIHKSSISCLLISEILNVGGKHLKSKREGGSELWLSKRYTVFKPLGNALERSLVHKGLYQIRGLSSLQALGPAIQMESCHSLRLPSLAVPSGVIPL